MKKMKAPKAVLFDMDGVLIDSMPMHVDSWTKIYKKYGIEVSEERLYSEEGRIAIDTIKNIFKDKKNITLTPEEIRTIYLQKSNDVKQRPTPPRMANMLEFVQLVKEKSAISVVTGSGQPKLMNTLENYYPKCFDPQKTVCAHDVNHGKPHPEPYLKGLAKHGIKPEEAIVVENAPLGTQAGKAAGIFVLAINSGKLSDDLLYNNGANVVVKTAKELTQWWKDNIE